MGEYYNWVNVDRKEYICPADFDYGNKRHESCHRESEVLRALRELLSNEWKGCRVLWMGDESPLPETVDTGIFSVMKAHCDEIGYERDIFGTVCETYKNVSGFFKSTEECVKKEIGYHLAELKRGNVDDTNEYGIDLLNFFEGLFQREGKDFRYIINRTKKICYSFQETRILYMNGEESDFADPLPILLGYGKYYEPGEWLGDVIDVADELPDGIKVLDSITLDW